MIVVGHQPQYIPHIAYFQKIAQGKILVYIDNVQFSKQSWQQRTLIKSTNRPLFLTIPVKKSGRSSQNINQTIIIDDGWRKKHWKSITMSYSKTPFFLLYSDQLEEIYSKEWVILSDFTVTLTQFLIKQIGLEFEEVYLGSTLGIEGTKTDLLIDICKKTGSKIFLSGLGAKAYVDEQKFLDAQLSHQFCKQFSTTYQQYGNNFLGGMAAIDALFMYGPNTINLIRGQS